MSRLPPRTRPLAAGASAFPAPTTKWDMQCKETSWKASCIGSEDRKKNSDTDPDKYFG